jgi:hypothetical protein
MKNYIRIDNDQWDVAGKIWFVLEYRTRQNSTAIDLTLKDSYGNVHTRIVPLNQIEWMEANDNI